jgi:hypothetical protein
MKIIPEWLKISRRTLHNIRPDIAQTPAGLQMNSDRSLSISIFRNSTEKQKATLTPSLFKINNLIF